jgi:hypothetical protein
MDLWYSMKNIYSNVATAAAMVACIVLMITKMYRIQKKEKNYWKTEQRTFGKISLTQIIMNYDMDGQSV